MIVTGPLVVVFCLQDDAVIRYCPNVFRVSMQRVGADHPSEYSFPKEPLRISHPEYSYLVA
jgi:hypothetical protein